MTLFGVTALKRMGRGLVRDLGALAALLGFLFTATSPGMALVGQAGGLAVHGPLAAFVCQAEGGSVQALPAGEEAPKGAEDCCLTCQAAQLANGAVPPQHFTLPTESADPIRLPPAAQSLVPSAPARHAQARAPPAA
ncbi:hypothetical protein [Magnetospirillum sp. UT-4]|uniref:hypothetical protein n=1 Tax=Magnetospirillum sp. UT-4 TaxID=2681467 RepID=UPI0013803C5E|nr:hypothetical protein [Magnetospirillum sp. UT-4]CAA7626587.1 conserved exported hypothetical protein [Magnetospirillum sp. UT-4]